MFATTVSFSLTAAPNTQQLIRCCSTNRKPSNLRLKDSVSQYPLATRIIVKNLPYILSERILLEKFSKFGQVAEVELAKDEATKRSRGFAFIQYTCQEDAMLALENMDYKLFDGRTIHVELAKPLRATGWYPKTSGPPKKQYMVQEGEVADCWY